MSWPRWAVWPNKWPRNSCRTTPSSNPAFGTSPSPGCRIYPNPNPAWLQCRRLLETYHGQGIWLERDDPGKLIQELLQNFNEPPEAMQRSRTGISPSGFWASLAAMFNPVPFEPQDHQLEHLRQGMTDRKRWRQLLVSLLAVFDPESTLRLGLLAAVADPEWLVLEGLLPDGTHLHLRAPGTASQYSAFTPKSGASALPPAL